MDIDTDVEDKLPDLFTVSLDIKVSNEERPSPDQQAWDSWEKCGPTTPFSDQEELDQTLTLYGLPNTKSENITT